MVVRVVKLIDGTVGKQTPVRVDSASGKTASRSHEHPEVRVARHAHQEGIELIVRRDPVVLLPFHTDELADRNSGYRLGRRRDRARTGLGFHAAPLVEKRFYFSKVMLPESCPCCVLST